jgi:hypothetical protein
MVRLAALAVVVIALGACTTSEPIKPVVNDFNGDSVRIKVPCDFLMKECTKPRPQDQAEADRLCGTRGKKAEFASTASKNEQTPNYTVYAYEHLFICV